MEKKHKHSNASLNWTVCQRLLGEVIPSLRAIACEWNDDRIILYFYHDKPINDEIEDHYHCIGAEVIADYPHAIISEKIIYSPYPQPLPSHEFWAYSRKEPFVDPKEDGEQSAGLLGLVWRIRERLLGNVIPSLRGLACSWDDGVISLYFYHDGEINNKIKNYYGHFCMEIKSDYPFPVVECKPISLIYPNPLPSHEFWAYRRKEPFIDPS